MSSLATMTLCRINCSKNLAISVNKFHTSFTVYLDQNWRHLKGLEANPNKSGPLVTLPDYSYKDNRPIPYGLNQMRRIKRHRDYVKKIISLVGEIDHAVDRHAKLMKEKEEMRQQILNSKLKAKGQKLITEK